EPLNLAARQHAATATVSERVAPSYLRAFAALARETRVPRGAADDAVRRETVGPLKRHARRFRLRPVHAVGVDLEAEVAHALLPLGDAVARDGRGLREDEERARPGRRRARAAAHGIDGRRGRAAGAERGELRVGTGEAILI